MNKHVAAMTGAELRTTREYLGFSTGWLARWLDVGERKIVRWEDGELPIPNGVAGQMDDLYDEAASVVEQLASEYRQLIDKEEGEVDLLTYRTDDSYWQQTGQKGVGLDRYPARWHRAICARVADQVPGVRLIYN